MIKTEYYKTRNDGVLLVKTYSDKRKIILQTSSNEEYINAIDIGVFKNGVYKPKNYTYTETEKDIPVLKEENENEINTY